MKSKLSCLLAVALCSSVITPCLRAADPLPNTLPRSSVALGPEIHAFTDLQGRVTRASIVAIGGDVVRLKREDGVQFTVKGSVFSPADVAWLRQRGLAAAPASVSQPRMPPPAVPPSGQPAIGQGPKPEAAQAGLGDNEMALSPDWLPKRPGTAQEFSRAIAFYSLAAVNGAEAGKETVPGGIIWDLTWLMPLEEAEKKLPAHGLENSPLRGAAFVTTPSWPQRSILWRSYGGKFRVPESNEIFTELHLICDLKKRLISVQLNSDAKRYPVFWERIQPQWWTPEAWMELPKDVNKKDLPGLTGPQGGADGRRGPYFNFLTMGANADSSRSVLYQVRHALPGVTCIHTYLTPSGRGSIGSPMGNVRWYLTAPLARKLLDVAKANTVGTSTPSR